MSQSRRYRALVSRITELQKYLLPPTKPTGNYTSLEYDHVRAFRVLAHAEIEACFEDIAFRAATGAYDGWATDGRPRRLLMALLAHHEGPVPVPQSLSGPPPDDFKTKLLRAKNNYCTHLKMANHGVRERNVLAILLPIGVLAGEIDGAWLGTIDAFGASRGETAHAS